MSTESVNIEINTEVIDSNKVNDLVKKVNELSKLSPKNFDAKQLASYNRELERMARLLENIAKKQKDEDRQKTARDLINRLQTHRFNSGNPNAPAPVGAPGSPPGKPTPAAPPSRFWQGFGQGIGGPAYLARQGGLGQFGGYQAGRVALSSARLAGSVFTGVHGFTEAVNTFPFVGGLAAGVLRTGFGAGEDNLRLRTLINTTNLQRNRSANEMEAGLSSSQIDRLYKRTDRFRIAAQDEFLEKKGYTFDTARMEEITGQTREKFIANALKKSEPIFKESAQERQARLLRVGLEAETEYQKATEARETLVESPVDTKKIRMRELRVQDTFNDLQKATRFGYDPIEAGGILKSFVGAGAGGASPEMAFAMQRLGIGGDVSGMFARGQREGLFNNSDGGQTYEQQMTRIFTDAFRSGLDMSQLPELFGRLAANINTAGLIGAQGYTAHAGQIGQLNPRASMTQAQSFRDLAQRIATQGPQTGEEWITARLLAFGRKGMGGDMSVARSEEMRDILASGKTLTPKRIQELFAYLQDTTGSVSGVGAFMNRINAAPLAPSGIRAALAATIPNNEVAPNVLDLAAGADQQVERRARTERQRVIGAGEAGVDSLLDLQAASIKSATIALNALEPAIKAITKTIYTAVAQLERALDKL